MAGETRPTRPDPQPRRPPPNTRSMRTPTAESYWVTPQLLAGKYPGSKSDAEAQQKLAALIDAGVRTFLDLTEPNELLPYSHLAAQERLVRDASSRATSPQRPL